MLQIDNLHADVAGKPILKGLSLRVIASDARASTRPSRHPALDAGSRFSSGAVREGSEAPDRVRGDEARTMGCGG